MPEAGRFAGGRHSGILVPLFSIPSRGSWGVGEIPDLPRLARWLESAGLDIVQLLPVNEMADAQNSPYSALSAMAIDPIYIAMSDLAEFAAIGGEASLPPSDRDLLDKARAARSVQYAAIRQVKGRALRAAYAHFERVDAGVNGPRARAFREFRERESWWLDDYALFRALHDENHLRYWIEWEPAIRTREPRALDDARARLAAEIHYRAWLQFVADQQWQRAREDCAPVGIFGDFPFMVSGDSADVWARQHEFRIEASVGVPPDAFSDTGQDWGLPAYRWDVIEPGGYEWLRQRARRCTELYDGFRLDHLVGFYRTFVREPDGTTHFIPPDEASQLAQGERLLEVFQECGARILVEDLGTIPDFVRQSLVRRQMPGLKVLRWERDWRAEGHPFHDPASYPRASVATTGTHDTETLAEWWDNAAGDERARVLELPVLRASTCTPASAFCDELRDGLLAAVYDSGSDLALAPLQDVFGWRARINTPAVVSDENWSWRLPWPVEDLVSHPVARERAAFLRALSEHHGR